MIEIPRCSHGNIILGCPDDDCPEQNAYIAVMNERRDAWFKKLASFPVPRDSDDETGRMTR